MKTRGYTRLCIVLGLCPITLGCVEGEVARLSKDQYIDKCKGAWAGQMIGVCYGEPYQFRSNGVPVLAKIPAWEPGRVAGAARQDDVYVELTFLGALERHGLDITLEQAGRAFAEAPYPLWHANYYGRENIRKGVLPPLSGHPSYNRHCDDIDFQIEADLFGIVSPGLPRESNRLCDTFGHIMNYGDGVYGGMFVAGMYSEAYFESDDVLKVINTGLACIPAASQYHQCITDTIRWCREHPDDWLAAWKKIEAKWNDDLDCIPGNPHNIDAKINGAYIVMGLLYGDGDLLETVEVSTRCGQDADSSTANAGGVIGCMKGYAALGEGVTGGIPAMADEKFLGTGYSFNTLAPACQRVTEAIVHRAGGEVTDDAFVIRRQSPCAPQTLEQWTNEADLLHVPVTSNEVKLWNPEWDVVPVPARFDAGFYPAEYGRTNVLMVFPINPTASAGVTSRLTIPDVPEPKLYVEVASEGQHGDFLLKIFLDDQLARESLIRTDGEFVEEVLDLKAGAGAAVSVRLEFHANDWSVEAAYVRKVEIR